MALAACSSGYGAGEPSGSDLLDAARLGNAGAVAPGYDATIHASSGGNPVQGGQTAFDRVTRISVERGVPVFRGHSISSQRAAKAPLRD
ncbi:MAG: hypothetical protein WA784_10070 [Albidovulum sp.]